MGWSALNRSVSPHVGPVLMLAFAAAGCSGGGTAQPVAVFDPDLVPDAYASSTAALAWPGATRAFQVRPDGDLYNGEWIVHIPVEGDGRRAGRPRAIAYEERWRPVAHWRRWSGRVRWDFEAMALPAAGARDSDLVVSLLATATNTADVPLEIHWRVSLAAPDSVPPFVATDAPDPPRLDLLWGGHDRDTIYAFADPASESRGPQRVGPDHRLTLQPGASSDLRLVLPAYPARAGDLRRWARVPHVRRADEVRQYWSRALEGGARFDLGDPDTERALAAARVVMLACRERRGDVWVPIGAPLHYRDVWLRDGARVVAALSVAGHVTEARQLVEGLTLLQWPMGPFVSQRGQLDGTGQALWAFEQALLRPTPDGAVDRFAEAALRAVHWYEWQREFARTTGWPFATMLPFGEPRDNELVRAQLVGNDAWAIAGYRAAARLLRAAHRELEADSVRDAADRYQAEFLAALARVKTRDVPPSWQGGGRDWGNLTVAWPCRVMAAGDARCAALARRVWAAAGGAGLCTYGSSDSLHYYLGADLGTWAMLAGRRSEADSVLVAMLRWRSASGGAGELFWHDGSYGANLPPHATSAAALVMLVRNALVCDDGDTLRLTLGAREPWWKGSRVQKAPTYWGTIDVSFRRDAATASWEWTPVPVWTALTLPPGTRATGTLPPSFRPGPRPDVVLAPPRTSSARIALAAMPGSS